MRNDYIKMVLEGTLEIERDETCNLIESIESEYEYISDIIRENSVLVEKAATGQKKSIFARFIEIIQNVFKQFQNKAGDLIRNSEAWKSKNLDALDNISYADLSITAFPQWNVSAKDIIDEVRSMQAEFKRIQGNNSTLTSEMQSLLDGNEQAIIKNNKVFKKYYNENEGHISVMKKLFAVGSVKDYKQVTINSDSEIKRICTIGKDYILKYNDVVNQCKTLQNSLITELQEAERELERSIAKESYNPYLILENANLFDTDLMYYSGSRILVEADAAETKKEEPSTNPTKVTVSSENESGNTQSSNDSPKKAKGVAEFEKAFAKLNVDAIGAALSVLEDKYYTYLAIIGEVVKRAKPSEGASSNNVNVKNTSKAEQNTLKNKSKK